MIWVQLIGLVALLLDVGSLQLKYRSHILGVQIAASATWVAHFLLLGATAGAAMNTVGIVRSIGYYVSRSTRQSNIMMWMVIGLSIILTGLLWQGLVSLLPMFAMIIAAVAFRQRGEQIIRALLIICVPLWFTYNFIFGSYAGMASDLIALLSAVVALYRYRLQGVSAARHQHQKDF